MKEFIGVIVYESDDEMEEQDQDEEEFEEVSGSEGDPDELDYDIDIEGDESEYIDECSVNVTHFDLIKKLGTGAYATVFLVRKNRGVDIDKIYALKVMPKAEVVKMPKTIVHMKAERKALEILRSCPYIQTLYYAFQTSDKLFLVTEYLPGGEMFTQVQKGKLPESHVRFYIAELIVALEHIHMQGIVYRDIKLENVLLDADGHVKLVDFGLCKKLGARGRSKSFCGTEEYMAPEVIACTGHNTAADWWALGVLAIELLSTMTPFGTNEGDNSIMNRITNEEPHIPDDISAEMEDFLKKILHKDPGQRLGGSEAAALALKQHRLFDDLDWERLERKQLVSPADPPTITHPFDTQNFSAEFTEQSATYPPTDEPPNSFITFKGYSYIAPELQPSLPNHLADNSIDENWNSLARNILSNYDPKSEFHVRYKFASHQPLVTGKSSVYMKCFNSSDNNYYAVRIYRHEDRKDYEIDFLQKSADEKVPGVIHLIEVLTDSMWTYLVMELIDGVNLSEYLSTIDELLHVLLSSLNNPSSTHQASEHPKMSRPDDNEEQDQDEEEFVDVSESEGDPDELDYDIDIEGDESEYIDECSVNVTHFDLIKKLGTGAYGTVFLVRKNRGVDIDKTYALKVIPKGEVVIIPKTIVHMKAERKALEILRGCPYIQTLYYAFQTSDKLFLVTEYLPGGEMFTQVKKGKLPESHVRFYIAELIIALEHIHMQGIVYRDIKLENVLMDADGHVKLVDFGLCKKLGARVRSKSFCGTEEYMAPEVISCTGHNTAADWWALGVLAIELLSMITPFGSIEGNNSIMNRITNEEPDMPEDISSEMEDFLKKILHKDPGQRLGGSEAAALALKQHRLFDDLDWERLERKQLASPADPPTITHPFDTQNFSAEFTEQPATYPPTDEPPNSFITFKGYSYIAPELQPSQPNHLADNSMDENWNSLARNILSNYDPASEFHLKYKFASHQPLGTGKSSVCMKCFNSADDNYYAVKIYNRGDENNDEINFLQKSSEVNVPGVVRLIEVLTDSQWTYVVMELIDDVNLLEYFSSTKSLTSGSLYVAVKHLCKIVGTVHKYEYTHGCICFKNIYYLKQSQQLCLIGFGNAKPIEATQDKRIDYWALGVCIYTMLCGHSPFNLSTTDAAKQIENDKFDEDSVHWAALQDDVKSYIQKLLCSSTSIHSPGALKNMKSIDVLDASKERLDENERIVKIRALRKETKHVVKAEVISEINGIQDSRVIDVDPNQPPNTTIQDKSQPNHLADNSIDENWNSLAQNILSNKDPNSEFHIKYKFASLQPLVTGKSSVYMKCFNSSDDNYFAVRIYKREDRNDYEIDFLQKSADEKFPGVIHLIEVLTDSKWTYLVMELIDGVNLLEYLITIDELLHRLLSSLNDPSSTHQPSQHAKRSRPDDNDNSPGSMQKIQKISSM